MSDLLTSHGHRPSVITPSGGRALNCRVCSGRTATEAIAAVKADKAEAIASFDNGTDGCKDRDPYPFRFNIPRCRSQKPGRRMLCVRHSHRRSKQIGCEVLLDREDGEGMGAYAKQLLEQVDFSART
jgi:hypothetical protein